MYYISSSSGDFFTIALRYEEDTSKSISDIPSSCSNVRSGTLLKEQNDDGHWTPVLPV